jgi:hypothetical protein
MRKRLGELEDRLAANVVLTTKLYSGVHALAESIAAHDSERRKGPGFLSTIRRIFCWVRGA